MTQLPAEVFKSIGQFLAQGKTGRIMLQVNCGQVERWELTESFSRRSQRRDWVDSGGSAGILPSERQVRTK